MKNSVKKLAPLGLWLAPLLAFAQTTLGTIIGEVSRLINLVLPVIVTVGLIVFFVGLIQYLTAGGDPEKTKAARGTMIYGVIIFFVMVTIWGLVTVLQNTFNVSGTGAHDIGGLSPTR
jgi:hypothetical protein